MSGVRPRFGISAEHVHDRSGDINGFSYQLLAVEQERALLTATLCRLQSLELSQAGACEPGNFVSVTHDARQVLFRS